MTETRTSTEEAEQTTVRPRRSGMPTGLMTLQALQGSAGNRAVSAYLQRQVDEAEGTEVDDEESVGGEESEVGDATVQPLKTTVQRDDKAGTTPTKPKSKGKPWTDKEITALKKKKGVDVLKPLAKRDTKNGVTMVKAAGYWDRVVGEIPAVGKISASSREAMFTIIGADALTVTEAEAFFKKRFGLEMKTGTDATAAPWTMVNITLVWKQLALLPESDVSQNAKVAIFNAIAGGGGTYDEGLNQINLGQVSDAKRLEHTVRHEVGHGVHALLAGSVDKWLKDDIGMWYGELDDPGMDTFVADLGGYPATYASPAKADEPFTDREKSWVRMFIRTFTGSAGWDPTRANPDDGSNVWKTAAWDAMPAKVKNACAQSTSYWYTNYENFQKGTSGNRLFLNHYYHKWFKMSDKAKTLVDITGENYTAMSEKEMFANAYAEYFADPAGKKNPSKWGGKLSTDVKDFFAKVIVKRDPYEEFQKSRAKKLTSK